jgi:hypothetical protein
MQKLCFFFGIFCFCISNVFAQHKLSGTVKNKEDGLQISNATIALMCNDSSVVKGVMTDTNGNFVLEDIAAGNYILQVLFIGYERLNNRVSVPTQSELGNIFMSESANKLQEVVVNAERPLIVSKADRYIVNVSGNIQSDGRNALDILRNTPGLLVNQNDGITVLGNSVQIWIDGRPLRMSGEQLQTFLNSMQGGEIDRVEVITNPSSRHDAAGSGGIVDIRTKKGLQFGMNGTLTGGYRQGRKDRENADLNLNWHREKFNLFGNYTVNRGLMWEQINQTNVMQTPNGAITFDQNTIVETTKTGFHHQYRTGMDYFLNSQNIIGVIVTGYFGSPTNSLNKGTTNILPPHNGIDYSTSDNIRSSNSNGIQVNTNYQKTFVRQGQQVNLDLDYAYFSYDPLQQITNRYYESDNVMLGIPEQLRNTNPQTFDIYSAKIDYMQPLGENGKAEAGAKFSQSKTDNDLKYDIFVDNEWQMDANKTNRFIYTEKIGAVYINISQQLGKLRLQAGLRGEYTWAKGEQKTTDELNDTSYFNLFPTFFVNYQASPNNTLGISYSRRLSRPDYGYLNPFEITLDAYYFSVGNPYLVPSYSHNIHFSYMHGQSLMARIGYSNTADMIMRTPVEDAARQRYGTTFDNFGRSQNISVMINYRKSLAKFWMANLTVQTAYFINTSNEVSGKFVNKGEALIVQLNNNFTLTPFLYADVTGMYISGIHRGYFVVYPQGNFSAGLRQILLKNRMTLSLTVNDIFYTSKDKMRAQYESIDYTLAYKRDSRYINLTLRYNFGSATVKATRNKTTGIEDETSRVGGR